jgi:TPR repeat protein
MWIRRGRLWSPTVIGVAATIALASIALGASDTAIHEKACALGDANGCAQLGIAYETGSGLPADTRRAAALYEQACNGKDPLGCARLARMYAHGSGIPKDAARAAALYKQACGGASASSCWQLGYRYEYGKDRPVDAAFAAALFEAACAAGEASGCGSLAFMLADGSGVTLDLARAAALYKQACDHDAVHYCANLGDLYEHGKGVAQDAVQAAALYQKACTAKDRLGCSGLASLYRTGTGVRKDPARAAELYRHECDAGSPYDCANLAELYFEGSGVTKDLSRAAALYKQACDGRDSYACVDLARMLEHGSGVPQDERRAAVLRRKACDDGVATACGQLATWRFQDLRLVAIVPASPGYRAYVMNSGDNLWPMGPGDRLLDGKIASVAADSVIFQKDIGVNETRLLFVHGAPAAMTFDAQYTGARMSVDLDADITALVAIVAGASEMNVIVDARASAKVRIAARNAPWDGLLARALADAGFGYRVAGTIIAIAQRDRLAAFAPPAASNWSGRPINLAFRHGDIKGIGRLFADISGVEVRLPAASCDSVTLYFNEIPWDQAFAWIVASCAWTWHADAKAIRVEVPTGGK